MSEAINQYPNQWIILVNSVKDLTTSKIYGDIYSVRQHKRSADYDFKQLGRSYGKKFLFRGRKD